MSKVDVLIVGAGPVGLAMAVELVRRGVNFRIIDKATEPSTISKALAVHSRTLELFEDMGVFDEFIKKGVVTHGMSAYHKGHRIVHLSFDEMVCPHPFVVMIPQSETERILEARLTEWGGHVDRGHELVSLSDNGEVTAVVKTDKGDETITADWLVACDGSHSTVRKSLGLKFQGAAYDEIFGAIDARINTHLPHDELSTFFSEDGAFVLFPLPDNRWRILYDLPTSETREKDAVPSLDEAQHMMNQRGPGVPISDPTWQAYFKINRRQVDNYRHGRIFLAGDAAHIHSPVGGVGMNTGIQDAINLAWKLELVVEGNASQELLDSYQDERHPVAKDVLGGTDIATKVATLRNSVSQNVRNKVMGFLMSQEVIQQRILRTGSLIGLNYRKSSIVGEHRGNIFASAAEKPSIRETFEFANGPHAGDRAPDAALNIATKAEVQRFFNFIRGPHFKLVLFDGTDPSSEGYANLISIAKETKAKYGDLISVFTVSPQPTIPDELTAVISFIHDKELELHRIYGASSECLYLIRPDGYIGFRSQPALFDKLSAHLEKVLQMKLVGADSSPARTTV